MIIRKADIKDIVEIENLLYQVNNVHAEKRPDIFKLGEKKYSAEELRSIINNDETPVFVADDNNRIIGYIFCVFIKSKGGAMQPIKTLYIDDLCVSENLRGHHIGSKLYDFVLKFAQKNNCYNVTLHVWECNSLAKSFYKKCGFKIQNYTMEKIISD